MTSAADLDPKSCASADQVAGCTSVCTSDYRHHTSFLLAAAAQAAWEVMEGGAAAEEVEVAESDRDTLLKVP